MSKSPSRSEIESALSGREKKKPRSQTTQKASNLEFGEPPRRQQVIGGDLSGVNKRNKFGIFSRYSEINLSYWIGGVIVLLIVAAFFWPQQESLTTEISKQIDSTKVIAVEDQIFEQAAAGNAGFARDSDKDRAEAYRAEDKIDQKVTAILAQASDYLSAKQYTQPSDANAVMLYQQVLQLRPANAEASENLAKIRGHFLYRGVRALDADKPALAVSNLERLALIDDTSSEYQDLASDIREYRVDAEVIDLLKKAASSFEKGAFVIPSNESALAYYQQALELREGNIDAKQGIQKVTDALAERANLSILNNDFSAASAQLETISLIDPSHQSIPLLQAMIANAKPIIEAANAREIASDDNSTTGTVQTWVQNQDSDTSSNTSNKSNSDTNATANKTPDKQASEQELFDKQYLQEGLDAYYAGVYDKAAALLQPLADKGIARAQLKLAYMHFLGRGFQRNRREAEKIVREALPAIRKFANEGRSWAESDLGSLYEDGLVLPRNYSEAVYWYRTAAEKGFPSAQTNLGSMYARGRGLASNRNTAIEWFQRAAKQGDIVAKQNLEAMGVN